MTKARGSAGSESGSALGSRAAGGSLVAVEEASCRAMVAAMAWGLVSCSTGSRRSTHSVCMASSFPTFSEMLMSRPRLFILRGLCGCVYDAGKGRGWSSGN